MTTPPVDLEFIGAYATGPEDIIRFTDIFEEQGDRILQELDALCVDGPSRQWMELTHKLKGSAGMLGANRLYEICAAAQAMEDASAADRRMCLADIRREYDAAIRFLRETHG